MSKILIAEDDPEIAMLERDYLEQPAQIPGQGDRSFVVVRAHRPDGETLVGLTGPPAKQLIADVAELMGHQYADAHDGVVDILF